MGIKQEKLDEIIHWWEDLKQHPLELEDLKSCRDLFQVANTYGFKMLRNRLLTPHKNYDIQTTTLCALLSNVLVDDKDQTIYRQIAKSLESKEAQDERKIVILDIPFIIDRKDLLIPFCYAINALEGRVNLAELIQILFDWDENIRKNFELEFFKKNS